MKKFSYFYLLFATLSSMSILRSMEEKGINYLRDKRMANFMDTTESLLPFHQSILENDFARIEQYFKVMPDLDFLDEKSCGGTALFFACRDQSGKIAKLILKNDPSLANTLCFESSTFDLYPLQVSALCGNTKVAKLLLEHGANIHLTERDTLTPLDYAIRYNSTSPIPEFLKLLVQYGAQMPYNEELKETWNAYQIANMHPCADTKSQEHVKELLMNLKDPLTGKNFLHMAVQNQRLNDIIHFCANFFTRKDEQDNKGYTPFHLACKTYNIPILELLLRYGCDINSQTKQGKSPLHTSTKLKQEHQTSTLQWLIDHMANLEIKDKSQSTPFLTAVQEGNVSAMDILCKAGANITARDDENNTALHLATYNKKNCKETLKWLISKNVFDINVRNDNQETPFLFAVVCNNLDAISTLKNHDADIAIADKGGNTALHIACLDPDKERLDVLRWLLENCNIPVNSQDVDGNTPLLIAARNSNLKAMKLLLDYGADINICNTTELTVLHMAVSSPSECIEKIKWLLNVSPELLEKPDNTGLSPLLLAATIELDVEVMNTLYEHGANMYTQNLQHETVLHYLALQKKNNAIFDWFISILKLDQSKLLDTLNSQITGSGTTPYMIAALTSNQHALDVLYNTGADITLKNSAGKTALWLACQKGYIPAAQMIINHGADVNTTDNQQTPLLIKMVEEDNYNAVYLLCQYRNHVDFKATNTAGKDAFMIACERRRDAIKALLTPIMRPVKRKLFN